MGARPSGTASGLSSETDKFLSTLMRDAGFSCRRKRDVLDSVRCEGALPLPEKPPPVWKQPTKPRPEQRVFRMARVGQRPLVKQEWQIQEDTNFYERDQAPEVPVGPSSEEQRQHCATKMWGIDESQIPVAQTEYVPITVEDQILDEIRGRREFVEEMHGLGRFERDGEMFRQIDMRMTELRRRGEAARAEEEDE